MKQEVWLRSNRRLVVALAIPLLLVLIAALAVSQLVAWHAIRLTGWAIAGVAAVSLVWLVARGSLPRLALQEDGRLAVYLVGATPIHVPIDIVECFFLGQGPSLLPWTSPANPGVRVETATLIVRLAESAREWEHRDVRPWLGQWCQGYITIRGTGCERLTGELVAQLNRRLVEAHRRIRQPDREVAR